MFHRHKACGCPRNYVFDDTLTELSKKWVKEVPYGSPSVDYPWSTNGGSDENRLFLTPDYPLSDGCRRLVWEANSITASSPDGGYNGSAFAIEPTKEYRRTLYMKKLIGKDGRSYFGTHGYNSSYSNIGLRIMSTGNSTTNPYFWSGDLPTVGDWYLLVGHVYPHTANNTGVKKGGIYRIGNSTKVANITTEFRWKPENANSMVRDYLYYTSKDDIKQMFFLPNMEEVNGSEMPLELLLGLPVT